MECNQKIVIGNKMKELRGEILEITEAKKLFVEKPMLLGLMEAAIMRNQDEILILHLDYNLVD